MKGLGWLIAVRLLLGLVTLFAVSLIIFSAVEFLPGDLAQQILGQAATPETVATMRRELGLDLPPHTRYLHWISNMVVGDFGTSIANGRQVSELLAGRAYNTFFLAGFAATIAIPLALTLGILSAIKRGTWLDRSVNIAGLSAISCPEFFVAYVLVFFFAITWQFFPSLSNIRPDMAFGEQLYRSFLPALTLTLVVVAHMMRMTRAAIINLLANPYIEMARLKGIRPMRIILVHALPNALAPIITVIALNLAYLVVGVVVVEVVFVYPGLGQLTVDSVSRRDITVVQASVLIFAVTYVLLNLIADVMGIITNPRLRHPK